MIQFNLLPDVKREYIKSKRQKRLIMSVSIIMIGASLTIVFLMFSVVQIAQKKNISDLTKDINSEIATLQSINDLDKILTIQSQLESLPELHSTKPETSRLFTYLNQVTPVEVKIGEVNLDLVNGTMEITGTGDSLAAVNKYADTLKFVDYKYTVDGVEQKAKPFTQVLTDLRRNEERATYTINLEYDSLIFDNTLDIEFIVPAQITTRSVTGKPTIDDGGNSLFEESDNNQGGSQ
jgi:ABC-type Na+ efflux pump permease subunit